VNFDENGQGINAYNATFSVGHGTGSAGPATQLRETYFDGSTLFGRSNGGDTNIVDGGAGNVLTAAITPSTNAARWANIHSVNSNHTGDWDNFANRFEQNPFGYIPFDVNRAYTGFSNRQYIDPTTIGAADHADNNSGGRSLAPNGIVTGATQAGRLAHNNGNFEFTVTMNGDLTDNQTNIEWAGNIAMTQYRQSIVTFVIDPSMKFVKYHAYDRYSVSLLNATTNVSATMYFIYHANNVEINGHAIFRAHQLRPNHVNFCDATTREARELNVTALGGNTANAVIANSRYLITLGWTANANAASQRVIPRP